MSRAAAAAAHGLNPEGRLAAEMLAVAVDGAAAARLLLREVEEEEWEEGEVEKEEVEEEGEEEEWEKQNILPGFFLLPSFGTCFSFGRNSLLSVQSPNSFLQLDKPQVNSRFL